MGEQPFASDPRDELPEIAVAADELAKDEGAFVEAFDAHTASTLGTHG